MKYNLEENTLSVDAPAQLCFRLLRGFSLSLLGIGERIDVRLDLCLH